MDSQIQREMIATAEYLGESAYYKAIDAPIKDERLMAMAPAENNEYRKALLRAWRRGYRKSERENN